MTPVGASIPVFGYRRKLYLDTAVMTTRWTDGNATYRWEVIASPDDQVVIFRMTAGEGGSLDLDLSLATPLKQAHVPARRGDGEIVLAGRNDAANGIAGA